jgi:predicted N-acyltransferase
VTLPANYRTQIFDDLGAIGRHAWDELVAGDADANPFLRFDFLHALHASGSASAATGWTPNYLTLWGDRLVAAAPLYAKSHSYGEYVFDWAWADAYHRHGVAYYPKLLSAVPFTPVTGTRLLAGTDDDRDRLIAAALELARALRVSSLHCLFALREEAQRMVAHGMMPRTTVQFHWANRGYGNFEEFLGGFSHDKRKKVKQERRRVGDSGIRFKWLEGDEINERDWSFLHRCYRQTYREHQSSPYLNLEFFCRIGRTLAGYMVLIVAERNGVPIAASLDMRDGQRLCGRYWGALEHHSALHFETCYYQGIEYCISRGLATFEGGSRGEHKLARGLMPVETCSAHWLSHPQFAAAVEEFLEREGRGVRHYVAELNERRPYK